MKLFALYSDSDVVYNVKERYKQLKWIVVVYLLCRIYVAWYGSAQLACNLSFLCVTLATVVNYTKQLLLFWYHLSGGSK